MIADQTPPAVSSSPTEVMIASTSGSRRIEIRISTVAIEQAFQVTGSTPESRKGLVESNLAEILRIADARIGADPDRFAAASDATTIVLEAADLESVPMHITAAPSSLRSW